MSDTVTIACKLRNGIQIGGIVCRGYYQAPGSPIPENSFYGYALTSNFPRNKWDEWFAAMKDEPLVTGNHVIAADNVEMVKHAIVQRVGFRKRTFGSKLYTGQ